MGNDLTTIMKPETFSMTINPSELESVVRDLSELSEQAQQLVVTSEDDYKVGSEILVGIKKRIKLIQAYWEKQKKMAHELHKDVCAKEKAMIGISDDSQKVLGSRMSGWYVEEQKRLEAVRREQERIRKEEADRLLAEAAKQEKDGNLFEAETNMFMAETLADTPAPVVAPPKVSGVATRTTWVAEITDPTKVPAYFNGIEIRSINQSALNKMASMYRDNGNAPAGVKFVKQVSTVSTGR